MSDAMERLTATALMGTARGVSLPDAPGLDSTAVAALASRDAESRLLASLSVAALRASAGRAAAVHDGATTASAPDVDWRTCSALASDVLAGMLRGDHVELLPEWCERAAAAELRVPPEMLPSILDKLARSKAGHPLASVIGERGRWLASLNPAWRPIVAARPDREIWDSGADAERLDALRRIRAQSPAEGRELAAASWPSEAADARAEILAALEDALEPDDEAFLESALSDRAKTVRFIAARLLSRIDGSALSSRMIERARKAVVLTPPKSGLLSRAARVEVELPESADPSMTRDGLEARRDGTMGPRASLLSQIVGATPMSAFLVGEAQPIDVIEAFAKSEESQPLLRGLAEATIRRNDETWAAALLEAHAEQGKRVEGAQLVGVARICEPDARARITAKLLTGSLDDTAFRLAELLLRSSPRPWTLPVSRGAAKWLRKLAQIPSGEQAFRELAQLVAPSIDVTMLADLADGWPRDRPPWNQSHENTLLQLETALRWRQTMATELT